MSFASRCPILRPILRPIPRLAPLLLTLPVAAQATNHGVSVSSAGDFGNNSSFIHRLSEEGRYVVFESFADNLVPGDSNGTSDVFLHDLELGTTELVSRALPGSAAASGNGLSLAPDLSADAQLVVWASAADDLVPADTNGSWDIFLWDRVAGTTERLSLTSGGAQASGTSTGPRISRDGRFVVFESDGALVAADTNGLQDVYRLDRQTASLELVSTSPTGSQGNGRSHQGDISDDGRWVTFTSDADNLIAGNTNPLPDVLAKDMQTGALVLVSASTSGSQGNHISQLPTISGDGTTVAFSSRASNLVSPDTNGNYDVYAKDLTTGVIERLNVTPTGGEANGFARSRMTLSRNGQLVIFAAVSSNLVAGDNNGAQDIFLRNRQTQWTERVNLDPTSAGLLEDSFVPSMTDDGRIISFASSATTVVPGDTLDQRQIYARTRFAAGSVGNGYCQANVNSTGAAASMAGLGSTLTADNDLTIRAIDLPRFSFGFFITSRTQALVQNPGGSSGNLCLGGSVGRYVGPGQVQNSGSGAAIELTIDLLAIPQPTGFVVGAPGDTWNFQAWYRDSASGVPTSNFTNGLSVALQ